MGAATRRGSGFEAGLAGWRPIGGARLERGRPPRRGQWAAILTSTAAVDQGDGTSRGAALQAHTTCAATAWWRSSKPGMLVELNLLEYKPAATSPWCCW